MKRSLFLITLIAAVAILAQAADITGKWVAQVPGRDGQTRQQTFTFKVEGEKLTGSVSGRQGGQDLPITEGKISGNSLSFVVTADFGGNTVKMNYTGTVTGDEIKMKRETGRGEPREFVAKRMPS